MATYGFGCPWGWPLGGGGAKSKIKQEGMNQEMVCYNQLGRKPNFLSTRHKYPTIKVVGPLGLCALCLLWARSSYLKPTGKTNQKCALWLGLPLRVRPGIPRGSLVRWSSPGMPLQNPPNESSQPQCMFLISHFGELFSKTRKQHSIPQLSKAHNPNVGPQQDSSVLQNIISWGQVNEGILQMIRAKTVLSLNLDTTPQDQCRGCYTFCMLLTLESQGARGNHWSTRLGLAQTAT